MRRSSRSSTVWANALAVTATSQPRARIRSIIGANTTTCGELVRSIQTRTRPPGSGGRRRRRPHRRDYLALRGLVERREHRQREALARGPLGVGQIAGPVAERLEHRLEMERVCVVRDGADPGVAKAPGEDVALRRAHDVQV